MGVNCAHALPPGGKWARITCNLLCVRTSAIKQDFSIAIAASQLPETSPVCDLLSGKPLLNSCGKYGFLLFMQRERKNVKNKPFFFSTPSNIQPCDITVVEEGGHEA